MLAEKLYDGRIVMRMAAVSALGQIGSSDAIKAFHTVLGDEEESVRVHGMKTLYLLGFTAARDREATNKINGAAMLPVLKEALQDSSQEVRTKAISAMCYAGEVTIPVLMKVLQEADEPEKRSAASSLAEMNTRAAIEVLTSVYSDSPETVRFSSIQSLRTDVPGQGGNFLAAKLLALGLSDKKVEIRSIADMQLFRLHWANTKHSAFEQTDARRGLPRDILATQQLTVPEKIQVLELLSRARRMLFFRAFDVSSVERLCHTVLQEENEKVRSGAIDVLNWLELLRISKRK